MRHSVRTQRTEQGERFLGQGRLESEEGEWSQYRGRAVSDKGEGRVLQGGVIRRGMDSIVQNLPDRMDC